MGMGGNFAIATPDTERTFAGLRNCDLTLHVSTKLNRSHLVHGREALILPCLGRTEIDMQKSGPQKISVEDSMSNVHLSNGLRPPASEHLLSELAIIAGIARATMPDSRIPWEDWVGNYDLIRDVMANALTGFENFNTRVREKLGFRIQQPARELQFLTPTKLANFSDGALPDTSLPPGRLMLGTLRSHDQFNTTIYSDDDRYRGVKNLRTLLFMSEADMQALNLDNFDLIDIESFARDGTTRKVTGYRAVKYDVPQGCVFGYMPELNVLCANIDYSRESDQPAMKQVAVEVRPHKAST